MINCFKFVLVFMFLSISATGQLFINKCEENCIKNLKISVSEDICRKICSKLGTEEHQKDSFSNISYSNPTLHCLTTETLTISWHPWNISDSILYLVEIRNKTQDWLATSLTKNTNLTFKNLIPETEYQIQIWGIKYPKKNLDKAIVLGSRISKWIATFAKNFIPPPVANISVEEMQLVDGKIQATVQWIPDSDFSSCYYDLVLFYGLKYKQYEYREFSKPFKTQFNDLDFETDITVIIHAKNDEEESNKTEINFSTPPCLKVIKNLTFCAPETPTGLTAQEEAIQMIPNKHLTYYDITVKWDRPYYTPDYYQIILTSPNMHLNLNVTISGNAINYAFKNIEIEHIYTVMLKAFSVGGVSKPAILHRQSTHSIITNTSKITWVIIIVGIAVALVLILFCIGAFVFHKRAKRKRYERRCKYFEELDGKIDCITSDTNLILDDSQQELDKWEIPPEKLILQSVLGEGAFGLVHRAWLRDDKGNASREVAVKMLKNTSSSDEMHQFMHEIEIMKTVGTHQNLVSLIGCYSRLPPGRGGGMMLVVEFCALGDLQNYLRNIWDQMAAPPEQSTLQYNEGSVNIIVNKLYDIEGNIVENNLQASDLLSFARQISVGMEFLSSLKVLHRDLAARNVLICADKTVKIADFGLSRDVYKENMYRKSGNGKLPIRWMAIESLTHQIYTSQSDVWSFGILLWEIVTLGGNPYPSIPTNALLKYLKAGYRMERPTNCGPELYSVMLSCWKLRPKDRPTFTELRKTLDELLESVSTSKYLDLEVLTSAEFTSIRTLYKDSCSLSSKPRHRSSEAMIFNRYVRPFLINNTKNSSAMLDTPIVIK